MTPERLAELRALEAAAYAPPWHYSEQYDFRYVLSDDNYILLSGKKGRDEPQLRFAAKVRNALPDLLKHIDDQAREIERLKAGASGEITCPFCHDTDFDLIGLKIHITRGWCDSFSTLELPKGVMVVKP